MELDASRNSAEPDVLGGDRKANADAFPPVASPPSPNVNSHATSQLATDQDLAENHLGDAIPVSTGSPAHHDFPPVASTATPDFDSHATTQLATDQAPASSPHYEVAEAGFPILQLGDAIEIEGLPESFREGDIIQVTTLPITNRRESWPYSLPTNLKGIKPENMGTGPRTVRPGPDPSPYQPFQLEEFLRELLKSGDKPGNSVVGDCVVSWKPSVVPQLFEFKYWFNQFKRKWVFLVQDHHHRRESPQEEAEKLVEVARTKVVCEVIKEGKWQESLAKMGKKERQEKMKLREEQEAQKKADQEATLRVVAQHALDVRGGVENYSSSDAIFLAELAEHNQVDPEAVHRLSDLKTSGIPSVENSTGRIGVSAVEIFDQELVAKSDKKRTRMNKVMSTHKQNKPAKETPEVGEVGLRDKHAQGLRASAAKDNVTNPDDARGMTQEDYENFQENPEPPVVAAGFKSQMASIVTLEDYEDYEELVDPANIASSSNLGESSELVKPASIDLISQTLSGTASQRLVSFQHKSAPPFLFNFDLQNQGGNIFEKEDSAEDDSVTLSGGESPRSNKELSAKAKGKLPAKGKGRQVKLAIPSPAHESPSESKGEGHVVQVSATEGPQPKAKKSKSKSKKAKRNHKFQANLAQAITEETPEPPELPSAAKNIPTAQAVQENQRHTTAPHEQPPEHAPVAHAIEVSERTAIGPNEEILDSFELAKHDELHPIPLNEQSQENIQLQHAAEVAGPFNSTANEEVLATIKSAEHPKTTADMTAVPRRKTSKNTHGLRTAKGKAPTALASHPLSPNKGRQVPAPEADFPKDDGLADFSINNNVLLKALTDPQLIAGGLTGPRMVQEGVMDDLSEDEMETTNRNIRHPRELAPYTPHADRKKWVYRDQDRRVNIANLKEKYVLVDKPTTYLLDPSTGNAIRASAHREGATAIVTAYETDGKVPRIEYDEARNRFIIYPHAQPWADLRNDALHPDFLPGYKLAEYQAYEYAGFSVWRHDRAQLKCALPRCTKMLEDYDPNVLICNGCGTKSYVRYCNRPHLLLDIENHWKMCGAAPIMEVVDGNSQPSRFYRRYPAIVEKHGFNSEQRHRQRANNMAPTKADYGLFNDSNILYFGIVYNNWYDSDRFNRCFNACMFDITQVQILSFMFRNIRHSLRKDGAWTTDKENVLIRQFKAEFDFDYEARQVAGHDICDCEWFGDAWNIKRCTPECKRIYAIVGHTFRAKGIDQMLTDLEAQHWILRVWRRHRPRRTKNWEEQHRVSPGDGGGVGWVGNRESELCL
ncbi:MAG: hypothetical protein FRX48_01754 [Lasallia pustulata]|uniref:Uncharacterized protein n=1 Tax=Lasallia pustulata TaxID=136370 RepID=A0A5M8PZ32_9LECA|nr:MAG: hypothetical protein FRX48_01754 [Lasallia pustulata]